VVMKILCGHGDAPKFALCQVRPCLHGRILYVWSVIGVNIYSVYGNDKRDIGKIIKKQAKNWKNFTIDDCQSLVIVL